jgi:uncharacterized protein (TIGR03086 family)
MDPLADLIATASSMRPLLASLGPATLDLPTPCSGWTVRELAEHVVDNGRAFAGFADPAVVVAGSAPDRVAGYDEAIAEIRAAYAPAIDADKVLATPYGDFPAKIVLAVCVADQLTHVWDLARAVGRTVEVDDTLADHALAAWEIFITDDFRAAGVFGPEVEVGPNASPFDRLAAYAGRSMG